MATDEGKNENNQIKRKLRKSFSVILKSIDPRQYIADKLFEDEVITVKQWKDIKSPDDQEKRAEQLLSILFESHHPLAFVSFRDALRLSAEYNWILELIDEKPTGNTVVAGSTYASQIGMYEIIKVLKY